MDTYQTFHAILVTLFKDISNIEAKAVITKEYQDITNNDMHIMEAIGYSDSRNMSQVAHKLSVTVGTLTTSVNSLVKKGYVKRARSEKDRRVVFISLTEKGRKAFRHHQDFHDKMIKATIQDLSEEETKVLVKALKNLNGFFKNYQDE